MQAAQAVHTCAQAAPSADLFGEAPPPTDESELVRALIFTGRVFRDAVVCMKPVGADQRLAPVLCITLEQTHKAHFMFVEMPFPMSQRAAAEGLAARLRKGVTVDVQHPPTGMRLTLPHAESITVLER